MARLSREESVREYGYPTPHAAHLADLVVEEGGVRPARGTGQLAVYHELRFLRATRCFRSLEGSVER